VHRIDTAWCDKYAQCPARNELTGDSEFVKIRGHSGPNVFEIAVTDIFVPFIHGIDCLGKSSIIGIFNVASIYLDRLKIVDDCLLIGVYDLLVAWFADWGARAELLKRDFAIGPGMGEKSVRGDVIYEVLQLS
jgi:hypothetical protein